MCHNGDYILFIVYTFCYCIFLFVTLSNDQYSRIRAAETARIGDRKHWHGRRYFDDLPGELTAMQTPKSGEPQQAHGKKIQNAKQSCRGNRVRHSKGFTVANVAPRHLIPTKNVHPKMSASKTIYMYIYIYEYMYMYKYMYIYIYIKLYYLN